MLKTRLDKLQEVFDDIDINYGYGPSEAIIDESKVDQYIQNFINKFKQYPDIYEELSVLTQGAINEGDTKSPIERLKDILNDF